MLDDDAFTGLMGLMLAVATVAGAVLGYRVAGIPGTQWGFPGGLVLGLVLMAVLTVRRDRDPDDAEDDAPTRRTPRKVREFEERHSEDA
jgi:hypothetical protein